MPGASRSPLGSVIFFLYPMFITGHATAAQGRLDDARRVIHHKIV